MLLYLSYIVMFFYSLAILIIFIYGLAQFNLLANYLFVKRKSTFKSLPNNVDDYPIVTIQLPLYNEKYVIERLLNNIVKLDYPKNKIEFQVLDDSSDESFETGKSLVEALAAKGHNIVHISRTDRKGFKAGALKHGLTLAKGEIIAIFDADFLPKTDWLKQVIPHFSNPRIGAVQTRWGHLNRGYSVLTKIQAFALDAHFTLEQTGRNIKNHCINFNGTAGAWRKDCIIDAGNWQADTLTEDLDLSYRAQLKKWEFIYLENVETPAELPITVSAARSQQFRWNKGGAENFVKIFRPLIQSNNISWKSKFHGIFHLLNSSMFLCIFALAILSVPMLFIKNKYPNFDLYFDVMIFFIITSIIFFIYYWVAFRKIQGGGFLGFLKYIRLFFTFYAVAMGFSFQNSIAVLEGLWGKKSDFVRTPKFNVEMLRDKWRDNVYLNRKISINTIVEGLLIFYFLFAMYSGYKLNDYALFPFHLMLFCGFSYVFVNSLRSQ